MSITQYLEALEFTPTSPKTYDLCHGHMPQIVLDLETMGTGADAAVVSIGAVGLDMGCQLMGYFHTQISLDDVLKLNTSITAATVEWWMRQSDQAKAGLNLVNGLPVAKALQRFNQWLTHFGQEPEVVWGNGPEFDNALLQNLYTKLDLPIPWPYYGNQSIRTLRQLDWQFNLNVLRPEPIVPHIAVFDAWAEAQYLNNFMRTLRGQTHPLFVAEYAKDYPTEEAAIQTEDERNYKKIGLPIGLRPAPFADPNLVEQRVAEALAKKGESNG